MKRRGINFLRRRILLRAENTAQLEQVIYCRGYSSFLPDYSALLSRLCILDIPVLIPWQLWEIKEKWPLSFPYIHIFPIRREKDSLHLYRNLEIRKFNNFNLEKRNLHQSPRCTLNSLLHSTPPRRFLTALGKEGARSHHSLPQLVVRGRGRGILDSTWYKRGGGGGARKKIGRSNRAWEARRGEARLVALAAPHDAGRGRGGGSQTLRRLFPSAPRGFARGHGVYARDIYPSLSSSNGCRGGAAREGQKGRAGVGLF